MRRNTQLGALRSARDGEPAIRREGDMHEDGGPGTSKLEKVEEDMQILEKSGEGRVGDVGIRRDERGRERGCALGRRARKEVYERRHDDGQRHSGFFPDLQQEEEELPQQSGPHGTDNSDLQVGGSVKFTVFTIFLIVFVHHLTLCPFAFTLTSESSFW